MESTITPSRSALKKFCFGHMKELEKISNLCFRSKMSFHKVIFKPITTAQRNLHFYDLYVHFRTPLSSHIQIAKKNVPKTPLLQFDFFDHHPEHIIFSTFTCHRPIWVALQDGQNRFFIYPPSSEYKGPKVGSTKFFFHTEAILSL